jgi:outer membrane lipopolysaccharide assembly protein LptE/RlpB
MTLLAGCGYYSTKSKTAGDIKSVSVRFFENRTPEPNLEIAVTELITDKLLIENVLKVVDEQQADAILEGGIVEFQNVPFSFNEDLNAEEYHVIITLEATLYKRADNEPVWAKQRLKGDGSYFIGATEGEGFSFSDARQEAIFEIAERIINLTVQDW